MIQKNLFRLKLRLVILSVHKFIILADFLRIEADNGAKLTDDLTKRVRSKVIEWGF